MRRLLVLAAAAALAGCAAGNCDPSQAGFLSGIGCEASGSYTSRNQTQQSILAQQRAAALQERAGASAAQSDAVSAQLTADQRRRRLGTLDRETGQLRARLASLRARGTADEAQLGQAQSELDNLQRQRAALPPAATDAQVRAVEEQRQRLLNALAGI